MKHITIAAAVLLFGLCLHAFADARWDQIKDQVDVIHVSGSKALTGNIWHVLSRFSIPSSILIAASILAGRITRQENSGRS